MQRKRAEADPGDIIEYSGELGAKLALVDRVCYGKEGVSYDVRLANPGDGCNKATVAPSDVVHRVWKAE